MALNGKLALVTGGSSGIGAAIAVALAAEGAGVVTAARRFAAGALRVPLPSSITEAHLDVTDEDAVRTRFAELPALDLLVCSAGVGTFAPIASTSVADLRAMLEVHIVGTLLCVREAMRRMQPRKAGHIVVIGSHVAHRAFPECGAYTAAKAGQAGLVRVLAEEARPLGIRITNVLPGATDTPIWDDRPGFDRAKMMRPQDVASFVVVLVSRPSISVEEVTVTPPAGAL